MKEQENVTDQGWEAMQRLLDQKMPRRRKRVAGWWWFAGLLLLPVIGASTWHLYQQSKSDNVPTMLPTTPSAPIAQQQQNTFTTDKAPTVQQLPDNQSTTATSSAGNSVTGQPIDLSGKHFDAFSSSRNRTLDKAIRTKSPSNTQVYARSLNPEMPVATNDLLILNTESGEIKPNIELAQQDLLAEIPTPFHILDLKTSTVHLPDYSAPPQPVIKKVPYGSHWAFGITFGANSERLPRVNGGLVGGLVDWQPLHHWGMRSGIQYALQRLAKDESLVTSITEDAYEKSTGLAFFDQSGNYGSISAFPSINTSILASVRRIHRIETPLLVYWQPAPVFRVYGGAILNYTFLAQTSNRIFADNQVFKVVSGRDEINRLATERLQRWQVKWQAGLGYRLGNIAELNASVQTTFPKISFKRTGEIQPGFDGTSAVSPQSSTPFVQVRQLGVTLSGVVFF